MEHVIFLHGALGSSEQLQPLVEKFKSKYPEFLSHSFDFSGHGKNAAVNNSESRFSIQQFSDDLLNYINSLKEKGSICIFGYSMGGYAALYLAKDDPELISKIFTLGTKFAWNKETSEKESSMLDANKIEEKIPMFAKALKSRHGINGWKTVLINTAEMMNSLGEDPLLRSEDLKKVECKVSIAVGDNDNMVSIEESKAASESLKNGSFMILTDTLHPIEKINTDRLCDELNKFFKN